MIKAAPEKTELTKSNRRSTKKQVAKATATAMPPAILVSHEHRIRMISEAAYFIAERKGFGIGSELENWIEAEAQIDAVLSDRAGGTA